MSPPPVTGLVLFAHGARDPQWAAPFDAVVAELRRLKPEARVRAAYLDFLAPTLAQAVTALVDEGCRRVCVLPMFLGRGGHVRRDLPELLHELGRQFPTVELQLGPSIGEHPAVLAAFVGVAAQVLEAEAPEAKAAAAEERR